jgi:uncharacterized OB-fold protein
MCEHLDDQARSAVVDPDKGAVIGVLCSECGRITAVEG